MHQPLQVAEPDVLALHAQLEEHVQAGDSCRPAAGRHHLDVLERLFRHVKRVGSGRAHDDGGAMLVVVKHGDVHSFVAYALDDEAVRRLDVFKIDCAECRFERTDNLGESFGVAFVQLDVEAVDVCKLLEQDRLAFHYRLGGKSADVAKPEHR